MGTVVGLGPGRTQAVVVLALALGACGKNDKPTEKQPEPVTAGSGSVVSAPDAAPTPVAKDTACEQPCVLLKDTSIEAVRAKCPDWTLGNTGTAGCDDIDFARNCVYATYGYTFKKARYKDAFGAMPWYKPDPAFKDAVMSKQSTDNIAELKSMGTACRAHGEDEISPTTRDAVEAWFAARAKGIPPLPAKLLDMDSKPITKAEFIKQYLGKDSELFFKDKWEPIKWVERRGGEEVVAVGTGVPDPSKCTGEDEMCEGFETIFFSVKDGAITSIEMMAAACPFVYERTDDGWHYRGEILRDLFLAGAETEQRLALAPTCGTTRTVRISEEKHERTYLDSVALAIDGVVVAPDACAGGGAMCADDGRYLELATGDAIELTFTLPAPSCAAGELIADGYYVRP